MRVLVTGGTGFVGAHTVAALADAGHTPRLLVRDPARVAPALGPLGVHGGFETARGDITDPASIAAAVDGCDAAVHAAAVVTFDRADAERTTRVNVEGTKSVLSTAWRAGLDPVVYVSSVSALHPPVESVLTPTSPVTPSAEVYAGSKAAADLAARELQEQGAPVVITYPGGVWGPHDPNLGESTRGIMWMARLAVVPQTAGGYLVVDVRDLGRVHVAALRPGLGPRRYMAGGTWFTGTELAALVATLTGRRVLAPPSPGWSMRLTGAVGDQLQRFVKAQLPFTSEGMATIVRSIPTDDSATRDELGVAWRDPAVTIGDALRWLHAAGHLSRRQLGRLA